MNLTAIAEGIESARQVERLLGLGCEYGQGYYFSADGRESGGAFHARANRPNPRQGSREVADDRKSQKQIKVQERRTEPALTEMEGSVRPTLTSHRFRGTRLFHIRWRG
jgi:EAL domain-containing protein (putative c-di-GMP-specific phosphodiesterase class I)